MRILVVEDDDKIAAFVAKGLKEAGFAVDHVADGQEGLDRALTEPYSAAVVDVMLPSLDGLTLIEKLRERNLTMPVIILSARRSVDDRIAGLQRGGDDYLTKPFTFSELLARLQALIRRSGRAAEPTRLIVGDLCLDLLSRDVTRAGRPVELAGREFALLEYLMRHSCQVVSKTMILERVWNYDFDPQTNVVDVLVCRLRNKIDKDFDEKMIQTFRGMGYVLKVP
jgi:DNA-binding response OmpR family regulator